jgi:hypothetical protein
MYEEKELNEYTNLCYLLLFKQVTHKNSISFYNFDINNEKCLAILHIANILNVMSDTEIQVELPLFKFLKLKKITNLKHLVRIKNGIGVNCVEFAKEFEWHNKKPNILNEIYNNFYKRSK